MTETNIGRRVRLPHIQEAKAQGTPLTMLTAYDALVAPILEAGGVDMLLVGDSIGNVVLGYDSTLPVTMRDIESAVASVARSTKRPLIIADMPFGSYETGSKQAIKSATRLMKAGAHAVKLEGCTEDAESVSALVSSGIPVMGHIGYTPQSEHALGGPRVQGRGYKGERVLTDALALQDAGAFAVVLEMVPAPVAARVTKALKIPTIGIGAGPDCDGQVLVSADMAGMTDWVPSFVHRFAQLRQDLERATTEYVEAVRTKTFPGPENYKSE